MGRDRFFEATGIGVLAAAALAGPAAANHDTRTCDDWRGRTIATQPGVGSMSVQTLTFWDGCAMAPGAAVTLENGRRVQLVVTPDRVELQHTSPAPEPTAEPPAAQSQAKEPKRRCKKKGGRSKATKRCRR